MADLWLREVVVGESLTGEAGVQRPLHAFPHETRD